MNLRQPSGTRHPFTKLLTLLLWWAMGMIVFSAIAIGVCMALMGVSDIGSFQELLYTDTNYLKIFQVITVTGTFIIPAIMFSIQQDKPALEYLQINSKFSWTAILFALVIFFVFTPFMEWVIGLNQNMKLPASLKEVEEWIKMKEDEMTAATRQLLVMKSPTDLLVNLFVIAVMAGLSEELFFRGCLQQLFVSWTKNYHTGIWIAAIIFSLVHLQFYGFLPRMLLGALFGYLFYYSKNLLIPIMTHAVNNGIAVIGAYQIQLKGGSVDKMDPQQIFPLYAVILSFIFGVFLLMLYRRFACRQGNVNE